MKAGYYKNISAEDYFSDSAVSNSKLKDYIKSPLLYHYNHVLGNYDNTPTPAMQFGSAFHAYLLEKETFNDHYYVAEKTRRGTAKFKEIEEKADGKIILFDEEFDKIQAMESRINNSSNPIIDVLKESDKEVSIFLKDTVSQIDLKGRLDAYNKEKNIIIDIKTTTQSNINAFSKRIFDLGYFRQAAMYCAGIIDLFCLKDFPSFLFITIETDPPYLYSVYELDFDAINKGCEENELALYNLSKSIKNNSWTDVNEEEIQKIDLPSWAYTDEEEVII